MSVYIVITKPKELDPKKLSHKVLKMIQKVTGSEWTHSQMVIDGTMYESTYPFFKLTKNWDRQPNEYRIIQKFKEPLTEEEKELAVFWWRMHIALERRYGTLKLFFMLALAKTKPFWEKIGYVPFSVNRIWSDFCSGAVDNCVKYFGRDLLPGKSEEFTAPCDILASELLEDI